MPRRRCASRRSAWSTPTRAPASSARWFRFGPPRSIRAPPIPCRCSRARISNPSTSSAFAQEYGSVATGNDEQLIADLSRSQQDLRIERKRLDKRVAAAAGQRDLIASAKTQLEAANAHETQLLSDVKGEIATLIAEAKARREAEIKRALDQLAHQGNGASSVPASNVGGDQIPNLPAPSGSAAAAIAFAESQLGKPYQYAATGPNTYDCSGLTMGAWAAAGVSMPHYSGAQYAMFPHVPLDQLQPGDLLFWGRAAASTLRCTSVAVSRSPRPIPATTCASSPSVAIQSAQPDPASSAQQ